MNCLCEDYDKAADNRKMVANHENQDDYRGFNPNPENDEFPPIGSLSMSVRWQLGMFKNPLYQD